MHELSICSAIVRIVDEAAAGRTVQIVRRDVGHLRQVVPETLRYFWDIAVRDTPLDGAAHEIDHIPARISCRQCGTETVIEVLVLRCAACDSTDAALLSGEELSVSSVDLADAPVSARSGRALDFATRSQYCAAC